MWQSRFKCQSPLKVPTNHKANGKTYLCHLLHAIVIGIYRHA